ncbi:MAG: hypothetical protein KUG73_04205 [Pseudomonadales bacterium]|nr:hypothetical protein [Pseudomonadales bacterium]
MTDNNNLLTDHVETEVGISEEDIKRDISETEKELDKLEAEIAIQDYRAAYNTVFNFLSKTSVHHAVEEKIFSGFSESQAQYIATRFVAAVNFLFLQKSFKLNEEGFSYLAPYHSNYSTMVYLTPFVNSDHIIRRVLNMDENGNYSDDIDLPSFLKLLFLWSPYSNVQLPFREFLEVYPQYMTPIMLTSLRSLNYFEEHSHGNREQIIQTLIDLGEYDLQFSTDYLASNAGAAWMNISYSTADNKYDAKYALNFSYKQWMKRHGVKEPSFPVVRSIKEKPVLGIMNEMLNKKHAMFRCFGNTLIALRERFYTIGFFFEGCVGEEVFDVFDEVVVFPHKQEAVKKIAGGIIKKKPDMLLYTSIGMNNIMIALSNVRLAPVQMAFMGHPNSTRSDVIDYVGVADCQMEYTKAFNEKIVNVSSSTPIIMLDEHREIAKKDKDKNKKQLDIVVPSMVMKLNYEFLSVLDRIKNNVSRNICYHFFPNVTGISLLNARKTMRNILPNSVVHPPYGYQRYLSKLCECDIHFGPFPFNNTNGNVDSLVAGLPMVVLRGDPEKDGVESVADVVVLQNAGAPEEMIANTIEEYFELACRMIDDDEFRESIVEKVDDLDLESSLFDNDGALETTNALWDVYVNHDKYQESDIKYINVKEV